MSDTHRIRHLDAWRFIAVSMVIVDHGISYSNLSFLAKIVPGVTHLGRFGTLGVLIFFFISGFVICRGLMEEQFAATAISLKAFYVRRALRILPPLMLYLGVLVILGPLTGLISITLPQISKAGLFLGNLPFPGGVGWFGGHTWSLAYEEQFYLFFPLLFVVFSLTSHARILLLLLAVMVLASLGLRAAGQDWASGYLSNMIFLLTGCAAALYQKTLLPFCRTLSFINWLALLTLLILFVGLLPFPLVGYVTTVIYPPLIALLVLGTPHSHPKVNSFFQNQRIAYLGKISYTVYLWQQLALANYPTLSPWWTVFFVVCVWVFAHYSYQYFERPIIGVAAKCSEKIKQNELYMSNQSIVSNKPIC